MLLEINNIYNKIKQLDKKLNCNRSLFFPDFISFPVIGNINTLYIDKATNSIYIWDGIVYQAIAGGTSLPEVIQGTLSPIIGSVAPLGSKLFFDTTVSVITRANIGGFWVNYNNVASVNQASALTSSALISITNGRYSYYVDASSGPISLTLPTLIGNLGTYSFTKTDNSINNVTLIGNVNNGGNFIIQFQNSSVIIESDQSTSYYIK